MERTTVTKEAGTVRCTKCQGLVSGEFQHTADRYCECEPEKKPLTGWICPVCGAGLSPCMSYCPCNNERFATLKHPLVSAWIKS